MNKMADSLYYSTRDFRDIILAELAKLEYGLREHSVNAAAVAQVRSASAPSSVQDSAKQLAEANARIDELGAHNAELEEAASVASIAHQAEVKKLRKENVELQGLVKQNKRADELEAQLEEAQRQIRTLSQENIAQRNTLDLNDKYASQDKKAYADLLEKYTVMETAYIESRNAKAKVESVPNPSPEPVEQKKEVKKVTKPVSAPASAPSPAPIPEAEPEEEQEEEEEADEEAQEEEEEGEEPVEFEYKGKTYYLSSDNDVYQDQEGEFVQVGTWNGKKIIFG